MGFDTTDMINALQHIEAIKNGEVRDYEDLPDEVRKNPAYIYWERKKRIRKTESRGYDVISKKFYAKEIVRFKVNARVICFDETLIFDTFAAFYAYLRGKIYERSCYYQYVFSDEEIEIYKLKLDKIDSMKPRTFTIDEWLERAEAERRARYDETELRMMQVRETIRQFCQNGDLPGLKEVARSYHYGPKGNVPEDFFFWQFVRGCPEAREKILANVQTFRILIDEGVLCILYGTKDVLEAYASLPEQTSTIAKKMNRIKDIERELQRGRYKKFNRKYFDENTHCYCVSEIIWFECKRVVAPRRIELRLFFDSFEEFCEYIGDDLSDCDLSKALNLQFDLDGFRYNENTRIPTGMAKLPISVTVEKKYGEDSCGKPTFFATAMKKDARGLLIDKEEFSFEYFSDFCCFLKNDLSGADLLLCDGLENLIDISNIDFAGAKISSSVCEKIGLPLSGRKCVFLADASDALKPAEEMALEPQKTPMLLTGEIPVFYISDLHLEHRLLNAECVSENDCELEILKIVDTFKKDLEFYEPLTCLVDLGSPWLLIGGDLASTPWLFRLFLKRLKEKVRAHIVVCLGNHELWGFPGKTVDEIVFEYESICEQEGVLLLHNELLVAKSDDNIFKIPLRELLTLPSEQLKEKAENGRLFIYGGLGFAGENQVYNANSGLYRGVVSREDEILQSNLIDAGYQKVIECFREDNLALFTHMPLRDWSSTPNHKEGIVYVSGHDHHNRFYDDGDIRMYADNQVGYKNLQPHLKCFCLNGERDCFRHYEDGIHLITADEYREFYNGKNQHIVFNRPINRLYMLKKKGYYCFIHENSKGALTILNGGQSVFLRKRGIPYYYENMDRMIAFVEEPLSKYQTQQREIAEAVKAIGGSGHIHGAIIDIDYFNHIFLNPNDMKKTAYFAWDIIEKYVYSSVPALLEAQCPKLFANYSNLLSEDKTQVQSIAPRGRKNLRKQPVGYYDTDIYKASRTLRKMQKLNLKVLTVWYNIDFTEENLLPGK